MLLLIGLLVVVNILVGVVWWSAQIRARKTAVLALAALALVIGLTVIFRPRLLVLIHREMGGTAAAETELRGRREAAIGELPQHAENSASAEIAELRATLAHQADELERLGRQVSESLKRGAEMGPAIPAPASEPAPDLPKSREISPPAQIKAWARDQGAAQQVLLKQRFEEAIEFHKKEQDKQAYVAARECVELYESSKDAGKADGPDLGGVTTDGAAAIYSVAAEICQRVDQHKRALDWARRAVALHPSPERKALLATTYLNLKMHAEANSIIEEATSSDDPASLELRQLLTAFGVIKPARQ